MNKDKVSSFGRASFFVFATIGIVLHVIPYAYNRSLWIDEAMLASSILTRNFGDLISYPLDWGQSAPVGYLYIVKLLTEIVGHEEYVLRMWSLFSFICCVFLFYFVIKSVFSVKHPEIFTLSFIFLPFFMHYSNELKPYMSDNMFVLLSLLLFGLWQKGSLKFSIFVASYSVIIWFSFASVFFIASGMIIVVIEILFDIYKHGNTVVRIKKLCGCIVVALSFALNYRLWLSVSSTHAGGAGFFALTRFIFLPSSLEDIITTVKIIKQILAPLTSADETFAVMVSVLAIAGLISCIRDKETLPISAAVAGSVLLMCIASSMGFYPIGARLVMFVSVETLALSAKGFESVEGRGNRSAVFLLILTLLTVPFLKTINDTRPSKVYMQGTEVADNMRYLKDNATQMDMIYVSGHGTPVFLYENGYKLWPPLHGKTWGELGVPFVKDNYIFGQTNMVFDYKKSYSYEGHLDMKAIDEDVSLIVRYPSVYIFSSHSDKGIPAIIGKLQNYGTVTEVVSQHENPMYHFIRRRQNDDNT